MSDSGQFDGVALPPAVMNEIDRACERFEAAWREGKQPRIDDFLNEASESAREVLRDELKALDHRHRRAGTDVTRDVVPSPREQHENDTAGGDAEAMVGTNTRTSTFRPDKEKRPIRDVPISKSLGRYEVKDLLGRGAFGSVYLGWDPQLKRQVAIKVPRLRDDDVEQQIEDLISEAQRAVQLERHKGIVPVYDVGREGDVCYIVSQYVEGGALSRSIAHDKLMLVDSLKLVARLADIIQFAHSKGWVHRDIKPSNILIDDDGNPYLTDFGLTARIEELNGADSAPQGTPNYMAPELIRQAVSISDDDEDQRLSFDNRTDIYSLGVVLYELLAGRLPFEANNLGALFDKVLNEEPPPLPTTDANVPPRLEHVCRKALAKDPDERYQTAAALRDQLHAIAGALSDSAPTAAPKETKPSLSTTRVAVLVAAGILLLMIGLMVYFASRAVWSDLGPMAPGESSNEQQVAKLDEPVGPSVQTKESLSRDKKPLPLAIESGGAAGSLERYFGMRGGDDPAPAGGHELRPQSLEIEQIVDLQKELAKVDEARAAGDNEAAFDVMLRTNDRLSENGQHSDAELTAVKLIELAKDEPSKQILAYTRLGRAQSKLEFYDNANASLDYALKLANEEKDAASQFEIMVTKADCESAAGRKADALMCYQSAADLLDESPSYQLKIQLLCNYTHTLIEEGELEEAQARLAQLRHLSHPDDERTQELLSGFEKLISDRQGR